MHNCAALAEGVFLERQVLNLIASTIILFLTILIAWYLYHKQLAKRDLFEIPKFSKESKLSNFFNRVMYFLKYLLIFPAYSFVWFLIFSFMLFLISESRPIEDILFFGIIVIAATRISAYVSSKLAEDMAKLLPWAMIVIFLTDAEAITMASVQSSFNIFYQYVPNVIKYLFFITFVEWVLRISSWLFSPAKKGQQ